MLMSTRTKEIIQIIILEHGYITMKKIADKMKISERTVYRNMNEISDVLAEYDLTLETVSKKGVKIVGSGKNREELKLYLEAEVYTQVVEPKERRNRILFELIHSENYIKAEALAIDLKTSLPTIRNDLKKISELCESYQIELVQKKGEGIYLKGHQKERDCLLVNILRETIEIERLLSWMDGNTESFHPFLLDIEEKYGYADMIKRCHKSLQNLNMDFEEAGYYMEDLRHLEQEEIHVMFLNTKQNLLRDFLVSKGTVNASVITPREILIEGLRSLAVSMILVHNHPSGDPSPSESDLLLTRRVKEAGDVIGISLLDHIIIGDKRYLSFRQQQIM